MKYHSHRIDISSGGVRTFLQLLGFYVWRGKRDWSARSRRQIGGFSDGCSNGEIGNDDSWLIIHKQDVGGLDVSMDNASAVGVVQCIDYLHGHRSRFFDREVSGSQRFGKVRSCYQARDYVRTT